MTVVRMRADPGDWRDLAAATDGSQAEVTRQFWAWYLRRKGARLPKRPAPPSLPS